MFQTTTELNTSLYQDHLLIAVKLNKQLPVMTGHKQTSFYTKMFQSLSMVGS